MVDPRVKKLADLLVHYSVAVKPGDKVIVVSGPLHGLEGEMVNFRGNRRVMVRFDHIGQQLLVSIPAGFLEPLR